jgi:hypothetical protein
MAYASRRTLEKIHRAWQAAWAWALRQRSSRSARNRGRRTRSTDLEALARQLHDFERQLGLARVHYASKHLSRLQLEQLYWRIVEEVHAQLRPLLVEDDGPMPSWATQRLQQVLRHWHEREAAAGEQPLHQSDVSELQAHLLEITTALYVCARVEDGDGDGAW